MIAYEDVSSVRSVLGYNLHEVHSEEWMRKQLSYLGDCERHRYVTRTLYNVRTCADVCVLPHSGDVLLVLL